METLPNQAIWIDQTMPMIGVSSEEEYGEAIAKRLQKLSAMGYPILVLFTSRKSMIAVSDLLDHRKVHHLTQEKNGTAFNVKNVSIKVRLISYLVWGRSGRVLILLNKIRLSRLSHVFLLTILKILSIKNRVFVI